MRQPTIRQENYFGFWSMLMRKFLAQHCWQGVVLCWPFLIDGLSLVFIEDHLCMHMMMMMMRP